MREGQSAGKRLKLTLHCAGGGDTKWSDRSIEASFPCTIQSLPTCPLHFNLNMFPAKFIFAIHFTIPFTTHGCTMCTFAFVQYTSMLTSISLKRPLLVGIEETILGLYSV